MMATSQAAIASLVIAEGMCFACRTNSGSGFSPAGGAIGGIDFTMYRE